MYFFLKFKDHSLDLIEYGYLPYYAGSDKPMNIVFGLNFLNFIKNSYVLNDDSIILNSLEKVFDGLTLVDFKQKQSIKLICVNEQYVKKYITEDLDELNE